MHAPDPDPVRVMGSIDVLKLRSCLTLFAAAAPDEPTIGRLLERWYQGRGDDATLGLPAPTAA